MLSNILLFALQNGETAVGIGLACIGAGLAVFTGFGSGIGEGNVAAHALDAIARNPEVSKDIRSNMILGIALTETTAPADADLAASVSIAVGDFMGLVEKLTK